MLFNLKKYLESVVAKVPKVFHHDSFDEFPVHDHQRRAPSLVESHELFPLEFRVNFVERQHDMLLEDHSAADGAEKRVALFILDAFLLPMVKVAGEKIVEQAQKHGHQTQQHVQPQRKQPKHFGSDTFK